VTTEGDRGAAIRGVAMAVPGRLVSNREIAPRMGVDEAWIAKRTGTSERPWAVEGERTSDFAARDSLSVLGEQFCDVLYRCPGVEERHEDEFIGFVKILACFFAQVVHLFLMVCINCSRQCDVFAFCDSHVEKWAWADLRANISDVFATNSINY